LGFSNTFNPFDISSAVKLNDSEDCAVGEARSSVNSNSIPSTAEITSD